MSRPKLKAAARDFCLKKPRTKRSTHEKDKPLTILRKNADADLSHIKATYDKEATALRVQVRVWDEHHLAEAKRLSRALDKVVGRTEKGLFAFDQWAAWASDEEREEALAIVGRLKNLRADDERNGRGFFREARAIADRANQALVLGRGK
jgi:hypothetical protein